MERFLESVAQIRKQLELSGAYACLLPSTDEYLNEFVPQPLRRLEWATGFTGSAGLLVVSLEKVVFFTDGRYITQAEQELPEGVIVYNISDVKPWQWCAGCPIYIDARLHTVDEVERYREQGSIVITGENPIDMIWHRNRQVVSEVVPHHRRYNGEDSSCKRRRIGTMLHKYHAHAALITAPDSICWLLNVRADDVPFTPLMLAYAIIYPSGKVELFRDGFLIDKQLSEHIGDEVVSYPLDQMDERLSQFSDKRVLLDPAKTSYWFDEALGDAIIIHDLDPCAVPKSLKNSVEQDGARQAHMHDGVALTKFLYWLAHEGLQLGLTECELSERLLAFRRANAEFKQPSFATIAGYQANGAIIHYHPTLESALTVQGNGLLLIDSGGQYECGTTDVTRTIAIGQPTDIQKRHATLVLKGHIALAMAEFAPGTTGDVLDVLARGFLNAEGLDYDHGTGHGVGCYLSVHEGPQRISKYPNDVALQPGMILSNEPGYYHVDAYGIRIENLVLVVEKGDMLGFETLTQAPIDPVLIDWSMLDDVERCWYNDYHRQLVDYLGLYLSDAELEWLRGFAVRNTAA